MKDGIWKEAKRMNRAYKDIFFIVLGSFIFAVGVNYFAIPNRLSEGGVMGVTIVTYYLFEWSPGLVNFSINAVLLTIGYKLFEKRVIVYTIISILVTSASLHITRNIGHDYGDTLLAALFAGLLIGGGMGLVFRVGGTTGGSAILARLANQFLGWGIGKGILITDVIVILGSVFVIGQEKAMYTLISVYVGAKVLDFVVEGVSERSAVLIISNKPEELLHHVTDQMARGLTILEGRGGFTGKDRDVLYLVINSHEIVLLRKIIQDVDPNAYLTEHPVQELTRTGFKRA